MEEEMKRENPDLTEQYPGAGAADRPDGAGAAEGAAPSEPPEGTETPAKKEKDGKEKKSVGGEILSWVLTILGAVCAALLIRSLIFEPIRVDGASMNDTLADGEAMFVSKWDYASTWLSLPWQSDESKEAAPRFTTGFGSPERFDVVIVRYPARGDTNFVKRLIGMPGDRVKIADGMLYVNGEPYDEPYISDEYRVAGGSNGQTFDEVYIPKAGDTMKLDYLDEAQTRIGLFVNGEVWTWRGISSDGVSADGDRLVYSRDGSLKLNGEDISGDTEKIVALAGKEFRVEKDLYFVMGDHRNNSNDSRAQGPITRDMIVGHVRFVFFPFGNFRGVE